jgi:LAO/AO transport system kinase
MTISGRDDIGLDRLWEKIEDHARIMSSTGERETRRRRQAVTWLREMLTDRLMESVRATPALKERLPQIEADVAAGRLAPSLAVEEILDRLDIAKTTG